MKPDIAHAALIDLDSTVFFQLFVFLVLLVLLNRLAFKPLLALFAERRKRSEGARKEAEDAAVRAARLEETVETTRQENMQQASDLRSSLRDEAIAEEAQQLSRAREAASDKVAEERKRLDEARKDALPSLDRQADELAVTLADKLKARG